MSNVTLMQMIERCGARVSGGSQYQWHCYGENARYMDFVDVAGNEYAHAVHDSITHHVYQVCVHVPGQEQAFAWYNSDYHAAYSQECKDRGFEPYKAWDNLNYTLVDAETILQYVKDIGELYYDDLPIPDHA